MKATRAAVRLAGMYNLDLEQVPVDEGAKVTLEDVRRYLEANPRTMAKAEGDVSQAGPPAPGHEPSERPDVPPVPAPPPLAEGEDLTGASVMVRGKFLGMVVGPVTASDGKRLWRVRSVSHPNDVDTIAYVPEDLAKVIGQSNRESVKPVISPD